MSVLMINAWYPLRIRNGRRHASQCCIRSIGASLIICFMFLVHLTDLPPIFFLQFSVHDPEIIHVLVTGGAGYIGSHAALRLLKDSYRVTIVVSLLYISMIGVLIRIFDKLLKLQITMDYFTKCYRIIFLEEILGPLRFSRNNFLNLEDSNSFLLI